MVRKNYTGPVLRNYILIKPKEVTIFQIIRLLFSSRLSNVKFVECSEEEAQKLRDIWFKLALTASALAQSLLAKIRVPMAKIGDFIKLILNLITLNSGLFKLLKNVLTGKVVLPTPINAASVIGNLDGRVNLDANIKTEDEKYLGALAMMAAKLAYEEAAFVTNVVQFKWKMQFMGFYTFWNDYLGRAATPAFLCKDSLINSKLVVVAFRGTEPFDADGWSTDVDLSYYEIANVGQVHRGFAKALGLIQNDKTFPKEIAPTPQLNGDGTAPATDIGVKFYAYFEIVKMLKAVMLTNPQAKFIVTGHSLGGALAVMFAAGLAIHNEVDLMTRLAGVYTFGQPRVGDEQFGTFVTEKLAKYNLSYKRYVYSFDVVPRVPPDNSSFKYKHFGKCLYFNSAYEGKVVTEVPAMNYFSLKWFIPKHLNAIYEIFRAFMLPRKYGSDYKEGWFQLAFRGFGLIFPGLPDHGPQDYVNMTRLGSVPVLAEPEETVKLLVDY